ncbi:MAG: hypothetical protein AB4206_17205 [Xenococcaceae cyanobacterium]
MIPFPKIYRKIPNVKWWLRRPIWQAYGSFNGKVMGQVTICR